MCRAFEMGCRHNLSFVIPSEGKAAFALPDEESLM